MKKRDRIVLIDYLKVLCIVLVIITHADFFNDNVLDKTGLFYLLVVNKTVPVFMFLSGYAFTLTKKGSIKQEYAFNKIARKVLKLTVPTIIAVGVYVAINTLSGEMNANEILKHLISFDFGYGSYYYPVMVQFVLCAPVIWYLVHNYKEKGLVMVFCMNLMWEALWTILTLPDGIYRIIFFRYMFVVAVGMYAGINRNSKVKWHYVAVSAVIGLIYILLPYFTGYEYKIFSVSPWNRSGMMCAFYVGAVMAVIFSLFKNVQEKGNVSRFISFMGKSSYHIMYTQMMFFVIRPALGNVIGKMTLFPVLEELIVDIVVSVSAGMVFCMLDNKFFGKFYKIKG